MLDLSACASLEGQALEPCGTHGDADNIKVWPFHASKAVKISWCLCSLKPAVTIKCANILQVVVRARPSSSDEAGQREAIHVHDTKTLGFTSSGEESRVSFDYAADGHVSQLQFFRGKCTCVTSLHLLCLPIFICCVS